MEQVGTAEPKESAIKRPSHSTGRSSQCRGTVTGYDWKIPELQERYDGYFSLYLQDKINVARRAEMSDRSD
jgi:hypothetical protein